MSSAALSISDTGFIDISRRHESIRLFVHPSVTLAAAIPNAVNESVVSIWIVDCPEDASHALLPAIPPALSRLDLYEDTSSRTRLVHELHAAGVQVVLSQYWLMECLRTGHVIPTELWEIRCSSQSRPTPCKYRQKIDRAHRISIMAQKQSDEENMPEPFCSPSNRQRGVPMPGARNGEVQVRSIRVKMEAVERPDVSRSRTESRVRSISTASTAGRKRRRTAESAVDADVGAGAVGGQDGLADDEEEEEDGEEEEQEQEQEQESDEEEEEEEQVGHEDVKIPIDMPPPRLSPPRQREWTADSDAVFALDSVEAGREHPRPAVSGRAARLHGQRDKVRFAWPIFTDRHPDELWSMYSYFLEYAQIHLKREEEGDTDEDMEFGMDPATGARVNALVEVPLNLELEITQVWAEIRRKYTRRNLDHLSVMLSSFRTARRHNLAPAALRAFYDAHTSKIRTLAGSYVPVKDRPPNFPWHDTRPVDPEGLVKWIPDWGQPGCAEFMGWDGQPDTDIQDE